MKKAVIISAVGVIALFIGATVIASEPFNSKEVTAETKGAVSKNSVQTDNVLPEEKILETIHTTSMNSILASYTITKPTELPTDNPQQQEASETTAVTPQQEKPETTTFTTKQEKPETITVTTQQEETVSDILPEEVVSASTDNQEVYQPVPETPQQPSNEVNDVPECNTQQTPCGRDECIFTDENHDGFCDYGDVHSHNGNHCDANHDGFCDYGDYYCMQGPNDNYNGVCDNCYTTHHGTHCINNNNCNNGNTSGNGNTGNSGSHHSNGHGHKNHH